MIVNGTSLTTSVRAERVPAPAEPFVPESVADHQRVVTGPRVRIEQPPRGGSSAKHREVIRRHEIADGARGGRRAGYRQRRPQERRQRDRRHLLAIVEIVRVGHALVFHPRRVRAVGVERHQLARPRDTRERTEQNRVDERVYRRADAHAQGERQDRRGGESRRPRESPGAGARVRPTGAQLVTEAQAAGAPAVVLGPFDAAEAQPGPPHRRRPRDAGADQGLQRRRRGETGPPRRASSRSAPAAPSPTGTSADARAPLTPLPVPRRPPSQSGGPRAPESRLADCLTMFS